MVWYNINEKLNFTTMALEFTVWHSILIDSIYITFVVWTKWTISSGKWNSQTYQNSSPQHKYITPRSQGLFAFFKLMVYQRWKNLSIRLASTGTTRNLVCLASTAWPFLLRTCVKALKDGVLKSKVMLPEKCMR